MFEPTRGQSSWYLRRKRLHSHWLRLRHGRATTRDCTALHQRRALVRGMSSSPFSNMAAIECRLSSPATIGTRSRPDGSRPRWLPSAFGSTRASLSGQFPPRRTATSKAMNRASLPAARRVGLLRRDLQGYWEVCGNDETRVARGRARTTLWHVGQLRKLAWEVQLHLLFDRFRAFAVRSASLFSLSPSHAFSAL